jgi:hypothetical protein
MRRPSGLFITCLAAAIGLSSCSSMLYYPSDRQFIQPEKNGLKYDDLWIPAQDGTKLHAWWFHAERRRSPRRFSCFFTAMLRT